MNHARLRWLVGAALVFVLIIATNLVDRHNFARVGETVVTLYEDRLVAKGLVYDMSSVVTRKKVALAASDTTYFSQELTRDQAEMTRLVDTFAATRLTREEERRFERLQTHLAELDEVERRLSSDSLSEPTTRQALVDGLHAVDQDLDALAEIQLGEGRRQLVLATEALGAIEMLTHLEIFFLVAIALAVQLVLLGSFRKDTDTA